MTANSWAALLTPIGTAALATIGVAGPGAATLIASLFRDGQSDQFHQNFSRRPDGIWYGDFGSHYRDDIVLHAVTSVHEQREWRLHCHGGPAIVAELCSALGQAGAEVVTWQDFLSRSGVSQIQIELREAFGRCSAARCATILLDQWHVFESAWQRLHPPTTPADFELAKQMLRWSSIGLHLVEPWRVALYGRANVGKSTLLNYLLGYQRAIVADLPGTTRDVLHGQTVLDGWPIQLIDGAGFRRTGAALESAGWHRLGEQLAQADLRLLLLDRSQPRNDDDAWLWQQYPPDVVVWTKADLPPVADETETWPVQPPGPNQNKLMSKTPKTVSVAVPTGMGLKELEQTILQSLMPEIPPPGTPVPFRRSHVLYLQQIRQNQQASNLLN